MDQEIGTQSKTKARVRSVRICSCLATLRQLPFSPRQGAQGDLESEHQHLEPCLRSCMLSRPAEREVMSSARYPAASRRGARCIKHLSVRSETIEFHEQLHNTTHIAMKKKKRNSGGDDMFADDGDSLFADSGELFSSGQLKPTKSTPPAQSTNASTSKMKGKLSPEERLAKFNGLLQLVSDHTGVKPPARVAHRPEQVRKTAWQNLFGLAANEEQLVQVTELFPKWREARREFTPRMAEAFVRE